MLTVSRAGLYRWRRAAEARAARAEKDAQLAERIRAVHADCSWRTDLHVLRRIGPDQQSQARRTPAAPQDRPDVTPRTPTRPHPVPTQTLPPGRSRRHTRKPAGQTR